MAPLRTAADRAALVAALQAGVIDVVATDHAPHAAHEKDVPFEHAPAGVYFLRASGRDLDLTRKVVVVAR